MKWPEVAGRVGGALVLAPEVASKHIVPECSPVIGHFHETVENIKHLYLNRIKIYF